MIFKLYATKNRGSSYLLDLCIKAGCNLSGGVITDNDFCPQIHIHVDTLEQLMALQLHAGDIIISRFAVDDTPEIEIYNGWRE